MQPRFGRHALIPLLLIATLTVPAAFAAKKGGGSGGGGAGGSAVSPKQAAINAAQQQVAQAQMQVGQAQASLRDVTTPLQAKFEATPEMVDALAAQKQAQADYDHARAAVDAKVKKDPDYVAASTAKTSATTHLAALHQNSRSTDDEISAAANAIMQAGSTMTHMQSDAEKSDPTVKQAHETLVAATAKVADLRKKFQATLPANTEWAAAKKVVDDATTVLTTAQAALQKAQAA